MNNEKNVSFKSSWVKGIRVCDLVLSAKHFNNLVTASSQLGAGFDVVF